jgi:hypothetical protein
MRRHRLLALAGPVAVALVVAGCGGSSGSKAPSGSSGSTAIATAAPAQDFPKAAGLTFQDVQAKYGGKLAIAPGVSVLRKGVTRVPFLVLDAGAKPVTGAQVAIYTMHNDGTGVKGPFTAREQPFGISPAYLSRTTSSDPNQQKEFYDADVTTAGKTTAVFALVKAGSGIQATSPTSIGVKRDIPDPPDVGDQAIPMHTLTANDVAGDYAKVTTRVPPDKDMVAQDFDSVLGTKPVVLVFATPALCQSRVCGPTVDVAEQVEGDFGSKVAWVHQEIYVDNDVKKGLRPQVTKWRLETEPWVYVIGKDKRVVARIEGAISVPELKADVQKALTAAT